MPFLCYFGDSLYVVWFLDLACVHYSPPNEVNFDDLIPVPVRYFYH